MNSKLIFGASILGAVVGAEWAGTKKEVSKSLSDKLLAQLSNNMIGLQSDASTAA